MPDLKPADRENQQVMRRPALDHGKKNLMMSILLRNPQAMDAVRENLTSDKFTEFDRGYRLLWSTALQYRDQHNGMPGREILMTAVEAADKADPELFNDFEYTALNDLINNTFDPTNFPNEDPVTSSSLLSFCLKTVQMFLHESLMERVRTLAATPDVVPADCAALFQAAATEAETIQATTEIDETDPFPENWHQDAALVIRPTGLNFIDTYCGGGLVNGETYGLLGPFGSAKTTIAGMLVVETARVFSNELIENPDSVPKISFLVSYEAPPVETRSRTVGYLAQIRRESLTHAFGMRIPLAQTPLSREGQLLEYERYHFRHDLRQGRKVLGEYERLILAENSLRPHLGLLDMTGTTHPGTGGGGVKEVSRRISRWCQKVGAACGLVVVDFVGAMIDKQIAAGEIDRRHERSMLKAAPLDFKNQIGVAFDCPVFLLHQFSGQANSMSPTRLPDHTDAADCKSFATYLDFSYSLARPEAKHNVVLFGCTKRRRAAPRPEMFLKIDGAMNRVFSTDRFCVINGHIGLAEDRNAGGITAAPKRRVSPFDSLGDV